jgi:heme-degrading monooxygenase HmoA
MFSVIFEVHPRPERFDLNLDLAKGLRPILEGIDGFIDNEPFESTRRPGWILSHSTWRDEKSVVRWRTVAKHHDTQQRGRDEVFQDYHLRRRPNCGGELVARPIRPAEKLENRGLSTDPVTDMAEHEDRILDTLKAAPKNGLSGDELGKATGLWSEPLYIALARMEHDGRLRSEWVNDPCPRRRLYHLTDP